MEIPPVTLKPQLKVKAAHRRAEIVSDGSKAEPFKERKKTVISQRERVGIIYDRLVRDLDKYSAPQRLLRAP